VTSPASDRLHRNRVARPQGDPSRITPSAEHFRAGPIGAAHPATRAMSRLIRVRKAIRVRVIPRAPRTLILALFGALYPAMPIGRDPNSGPLWPLLCASATGEHIANYLSVRE